MNQVVDEIIQIVHREYLDSVLTDVFFFYSRMNLVTLSTKIEETGNDELLYVLKFS
ncbi:MAG: hypothetical protein ACJAYB_003493 [Psychromonas sp.]